MPGAAWRFERQLLGRREIGWTRFPNPQRTHFTAVESDRKVFYAACSQMPGLGNSVVKSIRSGSSNRFRDFAECAIKTSYASLFFANIDDFISYRWRERTHWHAAWLDFMGPLTVSRLEAIKQFYHSYVSAVLIITAFKGRWNKETFEAINKVGDYSEWLCQNLSGSVLHYIEYFDTCPMAQFAVSHQAHLTRPSA